MKKNLFFFWKTLTYSILHLQQHTDRQHTWEGMKSKKEEEEEIGGGGIIWYKNFG